MAKIIDKGFYKQDEIMPLCEWSILSGPLLSELTQGLKNVASKVKKYKSLPSCSLK